jgi:Kef-type K+ transport system membrane component KefB
MEDDHELQVFLGFYICLSFALMATAAGLPASLGSFADGL